MQNKDIHGDIIFSRTLGGSHQAARFHYPDYAEEISTLISMRDVCAKWPGYLLDIELNYRGLAPIYCLSPLHVVAIHLCRL
jgi:hypothetical protein